MAPWREKIAGYRSELSTWWGDLDPTIRVVTSCLLATGAALIVIGFYADLFGVWQSYPFAVNIVSGVASACFGIPLALAVLRHLVNQQEDRSTALKRRRTAAAAAKQLSGLVSLYWTHQQHLEDAEAQLNRAVTVLSSRVLLGGLQFNDGSTVADLPEEEYGATLFDLLPTLRAADWAYSRGVLPSNKLISIEAEIHSTWRYLDDHIRPQLIESGVPWIPADLLLYSRKNPWQPFWSITRDNQSTHIGTVRSLILKSPEFWDSAWRDEHQTLIGEILDDARAKLQTIKELLELTAFAVAVEKVLNTSAHSPIRHRR
jgi:hypothetical protein